MQENETPESQNTEDSHQWGESMVADMEKIYADEEQKSLQRVQETKKELESLKANTVEDGSDFKSLHHRDAHYGRQSESKFVDKRRYGADEDERYQADEQAADATGGMKLADGLNNFPDDEHRVQREDDNAEFLKWADKKIEAKERGDKDAENRADEFMKHYADKLRNQPTPPEVEHVQKLELQRDKEALKNWQAGDIPQQGFIVEDAATLAANHILQGTGLIFLPEEVSPYGGVKKMTSKNTLDFSHLPDFVKRQVTQAARDERASGMDAVGRVAMRVIRKLGYADSGRSAPSMFKSKKKSEKKPEATRDPKHMSMKEFNDWRLSRGAKPY